MVVVAEVQYLTANEGDEGVTASEIERVSSLFLHSLRGYAYELLSYDARLLCRQSYIAESFIALQ